jgi:hypothetical protein
MAKHMGIIWQVFGMQREPVKKKKTLLKENSNCM